jgi:outer membrane receptor for ferrienterochelin and colicin
MIEMRLDEEISMMRVGFSVSLAVLFNTLVVNAAVATEQTRQLEEIVVTAVKREQDLQDVPVSVTAYSDELREELALDSIADSPIHPATIAFLCVALVGRRTQTGPSLASRPIATAYTILHLVRFQKRLLCQAR